MATAIAFLLTWNLIADLGRLALTRIDKCFGGVSSHK